MATKRLKNWWSVLIEARSDSAAESLALDDERLDYLVDAVAADDGIVAAGDYRYSVRLSVEALDPLDALERGKDVFCKAAANAGLPDWPIVRLETMTHDEQDDELATPVLPELLGTGEVAAVLGVSRQRLAEIRRAKPDFPPPLVDLSATPVWARAAVTSWSDSWDRRPGRPKRSEASSPEGRK